jgi:hypothetical protein
VVPAACQLNTLGEREEGSGSSASGARQADSRRSHRQSDERCRSDRRNRRARSRIGEVRPGTGAGRALLAQLIRLLRPLPILGRRVAPALARPRLGRGSRGRVAGAPRTTCITRRLRPLAAFGSRERGARSRGRVCARRRLSPPCTPPTGHPAHSPSQRNHGSAFARPRRSTARRRLGRARAGKPEARATERDRIEHATREHEGPFSRRARATPRPEAVPKGRFSEGLETTSNLPTHPG